MRKVYKFNHETGKVEEIDPDNVSKNRCADVDHNIIRDLDSTLPEGGYRHQITGQWVTSRTTHKELLREHNCIEVGNERSSFTGSGNL